MKIFGFAMVKNEADIIESFVRINSLILDEIHIIDDGSTDDTVNILEALRNEGYNITIHFRDLKDVQQQSFLLTNLVKQTHFSGWNYAVLLDADEFLIDDRIDFEKDLSVLKGSFFGLLEWLTFIPLKDNSKSESKSLHNSFKARRNESKANYNYKVVIPCELVSDELNISVGNHGVITKRAARETHAILKTRLAHIPVRSVNQILCKVIFGSHTLSIKKNRLPGESGHWEIITDFIREKKYVLNFIELQSIAYGYPSFPEECDENDLLNTPLIPETGKLRYTRSDDVNIVNLFDDFCSSLCKKINSFCLIL